MKKLILSAALSAVLASPAFAQATPMLTQGTEYAAPRTVRGYDHRASTQYGYVRRGYAPGVIVEGGHFLGQDPDPNVQLQLRRDPISDY